MPKKYNKLVRDKIPEIITKKGAVPKTCRLGNKDYIKALIKKLNEELKEFYCANDHCEIVSEAADMMEVVLAMFKSRGVIPENVEAVRLEKLKRRGGFEKRIFLESVYKPK